MKFFADRMACRAPLKTLFWRDMIAIGTALNLAFLALAITLAGSGWPGWSAFLVFLIPLPYNVFIWHCVWKKTQPLDTWSRLTVRTLATGWLAVVVFL